MFLIREVVCKIFRLRLKAKRKINMSGAAKIHPPIAKVSISIALANITPSSPLPTQNVPTANNIRAKPEIIYVLRKLSSVEALRKKAMTMLTITNSPPSSNSSMIIPPYIKQFGFNHS
jgi:hypothetical protein